MSAHVCLALFQIVLRDRHWGTGTVRAGYLQGKVGTVYFGR